MKKVLLSAFVCAALSVSAYAEGTETVKPKEEKKTDDATPIACTGTLVVWQGSNPVNIKVVLNNDIKTKDDCEKWVGGEAASLQKQLGSSYTVKESFSFAG